jgi:hypothetical protein
VDDSLNAEDLFNKSKKQRGRPPEKKDEVKSEVTRLLQNGAMPSADLESAVCAATGCHAQTVKAAKKDLGVKCYQSGGAWYSRLLGQSTENSQSTINAEMGDMTETP